MVAVATEVVAVFGQGLLHLVRTALDLLSDRKDRREQTRHVRTRHARAAGRLIMLINAVDAALQRKVSASRCVHVSQEAITSGRTARPEKGTLPHISCREVSLPLALTSVQFHPGTHRGFDRRTQSLCREAALRCESLRLVRLRAISDTAFASSRKTADTCRDSQDRSLNPSVESICRSVASGDRSSRNSQTNEIRVSKRE